MFKDADSVPQVATFKRYFENANIRSETLASVTASIDKSTPNPVNHTPIAVNDFITTLKNNSVISSNVLANDRDKDGDRLDIISFDSHSKQGGAVLNKGSGIFNYTPATDFTGQDSFTYTISDANGAEATAIVKIDISDSPSKQGGAMTLWFLLLGLLLSLKQKNRKNIPSGNICTRT